MRRKWLLGLLTAVLLAILPLNVFAKQNPITFGDYRISYKIVKDPRAARNTFDSDDDDDNKAKNAGYLILDVEEAGDEFLKGEDLDDDGFTIYDGQMQLSSLEVDDLGKDVIKKYHPTKKMPTLEEGVYNKARFMYAISPSDDIKLKPNEGTKIFLQHAQSSDGIFTDEPVLTKEGRHE